MGKTVNQIRLSGLHGNGQKLTCGHIVTPDHQTLGMYLQLHQGT